MVGSGISNADDYKAVHVNLYTAGFADRLSLVGGNLEREFRGHDWRADLKETPGNGFAIELELPKDFVLPNYNFTNYQVTL